MSNIVVTGASGEFGGGIAQAVLQALTPARLVATVRDLSRAKDLVDQDVDVRVADFDDRDLLRSAFAGADTVFINATFFGTVTALRQQRVANAIDATQEAVPRVIMTSWPDLEHCDLAAIADYRASEERLRSTSSDWTILRLGYGIADAVARDVKWGVRDGRVVAPAASAIIRPVAVADLVEASATVLLGEGHSREILEIRNPAAINWNGVAELASRISGHAIPYEPVDDDGYRDYLGSIGLNPGFADGLLDLYRIFRAGWASESDEALENLLERTPQTPENAILARADSPPR
jgi:NAD(P)H dehydrogenase (quinone)